MIFSSNLVYRVYYSFGLCKNDQSYDSTDFVDPNDMIYNKTLSCLTPISVVIRNKTLEELPIFRSSAVVLETIVGVSLRIS